MDKLIKDFIENKCEYKGNWDNRLEENLNNTYGENDYLTYLLIIGKKALEDGNREVVQYVSSILYGYVKDGKRVLSREHIKFLQRAENISKGQYMVQKRNMYITSLIVTFISFLILIFIFDVKIQYGIGFLAFMIFLDIFLINRNMDGIYSQATKKELIREVDGKIIDFVKRHNF